MGTCDYTSGSCLLQDVLKDETAREQTTLDRDEIEIHGYVAARIYSIYIVHDLLTVLRERARGPRRTPACCVATRLARCRARSGFASLFAHIHAISALATRLLLLIRVSALATRPCACYASPRLLVRHSRAPQARGAHFFL